MNRRHATKWYSFLRTVLENSDPIILASLDPGEVPREEVILKGLPASGGIAIGPAFVYEREEVFVCERDLTDDEVEPEILLFQHAIDRVEEEITSIATYTRERLGSEMAEIFEAQILMLHDVELMSAIEKRIRHERKNADFIIQEELEKYRTLMTSAGPSFLSDRLEDLNDIVQRILRGIQQKRLHSSLEGRHVVFSRSLSPADTILFSTGDVLGYATDLGGLTSHAAILARSLAIPAVVALHGAVDQVRTGDKVILDGQRGLLIIHPTEDHTREYIAKLERIQECVRKLEGLAKLPCVTQDGRSVELSGNAEFINELDYVLTQGANGIGLYRTEHLYLATGDFPSEQEQTFAYTEIAQMMYPRPVIFRTFDIGGDKLLESGYEEANPFLGWRGIRLMLDKPDIFMQQLRAILRASTMKNVKIMFPMVSGIVQFRQAMEYFEAARQDLRAQKIPFDEAMEVGVMIEVPSVIFVARELARLVQFFSIGTNDLVQYLIAVDRNNDRISELYQEFHPAVIRAIKQIIQVGHEEGIWVGMCGEMAGNPLAVPLLIGLGLDEFSMVPSAIPEVKNIIRQLTVREAQAVAERCLACSTTIEIKDILNSWIRQHHPDILLLNGNGAHKP